MTFAWSTVEVIDREERRTQSDAAIAPSLNGGATGEAHNSGTDPSAAVDGPDDDILLSRIGADDQTAFRALMARHYRRVFSLVYRMIPNKADAEDLAQDIFFTVWVKRAEWQPGNAAFTTWLYRVTVNRCIDFKRKAKPTSSEDGVPELADDRPDAAALVHRHQTSEILRQATLKLSDEQQAALALFYQQGLSNAEAAEILGTSVSAVESLLKRARKRLREILRNRSKDL